MNKIITRDDFIEYIMKTLGHPVLTVNITEEQVNYRIDDALLKFFEFHNEGTYRYYILHEITDDEVKNGYLVLPDKVMSVICIYPTDGVFTTTNTNNLAATTYLQSIGTSAYTGGMNGYGGALFGSGRGYAGGGASSRFTLSNAIYSASYLSTLTATLNGYHNFQYTRYGQKLFIDDRTLNVGAGQKVLVEVYMEVDPDNQPIWNSIWLREYATMLCMRQWGMNLIKFGDTQLANGTTINGDRILQEANERIKELELELQSTWSEPLGVFMG